MKRIFSPIKKIFSLPKKILIPGIIIIALLGFFLLKPKNNTQVLQFATVKKQDIKSTVSSSGTLTGRQSVNLKFKSGGKLAYLNVKEGDVVSSSQVIAGLDTQDLAIALQQARNNFVSLDAAAKKAEDDVKGNDTTESFTQKQTRTAAQVARDNAFDSIKAAQRTFQDAVIVAPISGLVTQAPPIVGQIVSSSDLIAQVVNTKDIFFDTDVDEADVSKISVGQKAQVTMDSFGDKVFTGSASEIIPQTKTTSSGATVVTVRVQLDSPPEPFVNGLTGQASIITSQASNVLTIPQEALREDNTVVIQTENGFKSQKVTPGIYSDTDVEIKEGLKEGDRVVLNPPANLTIGGSRGTNRNTNPLQGIIFRVFGGPRGAGGLRLGR